MEPQITAKRIMEFRAATGLGVLDAKQFLEDHPQPLVERIVAAAQVAGRIPDLHLLVTSDKEFQDRLFSAAEISSTHSHLRDPIENDPIHGVIVRRVIGDVTREMDERGEGRELGSCHLLWRTCKERLIRDHNIVWYSPIDLNPGACFD